MGISGAWATLSSSTIAKSGSVTDSWNIGADITTDNWTEMGGNTPTAVTALGSYTAYYRTQDITLSAAGSLSITFQYSSGNDMLELLGVDLLNSSDEVVKSDYHYGYTGGNKEHNVFMLDNVASGSYKIRFIVNKIVKASGVISSVGSITVKHVDIQTASSYADITQWYFVRLHSDNNYYIYYNGTSIAFNNGSKANEDKYLWGFVKDTDGIKIYNKAAGGSVALDNANPCTMSADGTSVAFSFAPGSTGNYGASADAYFALYKIIKGNKNNSFLNYQSGSIKRYDSDDTGSTFMIDEAPIAGGKVYKLKAYFSSYTDLYFTNNDGTLVFNSSATNGVKDYWILRSSGNSTYPWTLESGRGDGKFLTPTNVGLSTTGGWVQINNCATNTTYYHLYGSIDGATTTGYIRNLATWSPEGASKKNGFAQYGSGGCYGTAHNNSEWSTDYAIEEVTGVDIYTVVSNINAGGVTYSYYTGKKDQTNGGFYILASEPSASDFSAISVTDFTPGAITVNTTTKTITVNYSSSYSYTFTDVNGQKYTGTITGEFGVTPTLTGCYGYTLSNEVWDEGTNTYTADISFPFPVSSNSVANWIYINIFDAKPSYQISDGHWFYWHANSTNVIVHNCDEPTNESGKIDEYKWAIVPSITNGEITFTIKNAVANKYIYHDGSESYSSHTGIKLGDTGVSLTYVKDASAAKYYWYIPSVGKYLSANSVNGDESQRLGALSAVHDGESVGFYTPADFTTLLTNLKTARTTFNNYFLPWSLGKYTETVEGTMTTVYNAQISTDRNVVKDPPSAYFTASQFKTYTDNYNNAVDGLRYVVPTFFRVKNLDGSKYVKAGWRDYVNYIQLAFSSGGTDASSIFYLNASNNIISYYSGLYLFAINCTCPIENSWYRDKMTTYEFLPGSDVNRVYVHAASNPSNWGGEEKFWIATDTKVGRGTAPTADSDFLIEEVTSLPITLTDLSSYGIEGCYATFYTPVKVEIDGATAYTLSLTDGGTLRATEVENNIVPAGTGVILVGDNTSATATITSDEAQSEKGGLSGSCVAMNSPENSYIFTALTDDGGSTYTLGFFKNGFDVIPGFKAYYQSEQGLSTVRGFSISFDLNDAIADVISTLTPKSVYDLQGRRVNMSAKGLYIINGKKVIK